MTICTVPLFNVEHLLFDALGSAMVTGVTYILPVFIMSRLWTNYSYPALYGKRVFVIPEFVDTFVRLALLLGGSFALWRIRGCNGGTFDGAALQLFFYIAHILMFAMTKVTLRSEITLFIALVVAVLNLCFSILVLIWFLDDLYAMIYTIVALLYAAYWLIMMLIIAWNWKPYQIFLSDYRIKARQINEKRTMMMEDCHAQFERDSLKVVDEYSNELPQTETTTTVTTTTVTKEDQEPQASQFGRSSSSKFVIPMDGSSFASVEINKRK